MEADRNLGSGAEDQSKGAADQEIDDEKVEKFYDLIRNYKEARDRQRIGMQRLPAGEVSDYEDGEKRRRMKKLKSADRDQTSWIPAFKWEDFTPAEHRPSSLIPSASNSGEIEKERRMRRDMKDSPPILADLDDSGLDLKLKL